jgi:hypothetical protein
MIGMLALLGVISGCTSGGSAQLKPETFVGEYVFQMGVVSRILLKSV